VKQELLLPDVDKKNIYAEINFSCKKVPEELAL